LQPDIRSATTAAAECLRGSLQRIPAANATVSVHGQKARVPCQLYSFQAPRRQITVDEPGYGARQRRKATVMASTGLLVMPGNAVAVEEAGDLVQAEVTLFAEAHKFRRFDFRHDRERGTFRHTS
jgi:hypothetical protein